MTRKSSVLVSQVRLKMTCEWDHTPFLSSIRVCAHPSLAHSFTFCYSLYRQNVWHLRTLLLFCCCLPQNLNNCTDCSGCSSELLHCHGETHGLPTRSHNDPHTTISASTSKWLGINLWYQSEAFIRLAPFDSRVSSGSKKFTIAAIEEVSPDNLSEKPSSVKSNACLCSRSLEQFCTTNSKKLFQVFIC